MFDVMMANSGESEPTLPSFKFYDGLDDHSYVWEVRSPFASVVDEALIEVAVPKQSG